ncbi:discoidin domain-containing protein [Arachidicoccus ginsenosidivorans]|nr:discoidin domain-containing protein [Arachidicoccus ginsenosidivorans]
MKSKYLLLTYMTLFWLLVVCQLGYTQNVNLGPKNLINKSGFDKPKVVVSETDSADDGTLYRYTSDQYYNLNVVYIIPTDYTSTPDFRERMSSILLRGRQYYGQQMAAHGYGFKTFGLLRDTMKNLVDMIILKGKYPTSGYRYENYSHAKQEVDSFFAENPSRNHSVHTLIITPMGGPFYGIGKWCFAIDHGAGFSINDSSSKYIGGMFHEMGHAFTLPHNSVKANEPALGTALLGYGNYTWGHPGRTTSLTDADCAILNEIQVFNKDTGTYYQPVKVSLVRLHARFDSIKKAITISGKFKSNATLNHVVYYADPNIDNEGEGVNRDYNALSWATPVIGKDSFYLEMPLAAFIYKHGWVSYQMKIMPIAAKVGIATEFDEHFNINDGVPIVAFGTKKALDKKGWTARASSEQINYEPAAVSNIIDGHKDTYWSSRWNPAPDSAALKLPFVINIDLKRSRRIGGFSIQNRPIAINNTPREIKVLTSNDGKSWKIAASRAIFDRTPGLQYAYFDRAVIARYVRLIIKSINYSGGDYSCSFAEFGLFAPDR